MKCEEAKELLSAMVDGEVTKVEEEKVSMHLRECSVCRRRLQEERGLKQRISSIYSEKRIDEKVKEEIFKMIDERTTTFPAVLKRQFPIPLFAGLGLALVLIIFSYLYIGFPFGVKRFPEKLISYAGKMIERIQVENSAIQYLTSDPALLEEYFKKNVEINFEVPVPDMSGAGYELFGGSVEKLNSIPVAISVYKSEKTIVLNIMFEGEGFEGEEFGKEIVDEWSGLGFYISAKGNLNSVAWWMGDELCIVVSTLPHEKLIEFITAGG